MKKLIVLAVLALAGCEEQHETTHDELAVKSVLLREPIDYDRGNPPVVRILSGAAAGQARIVVGVRDGRAFVEPPFDPPVGDEDSYEIVEPPPALPDCDDNLSNAPCRMVSSTIIASELPDPKRAVIAYEDGPVFESAVVGDSGRNTVFLGENPDVEDDTYVGMALFLDGRLRGCIHAYQASTRAVTFGDCDL